VGIFQLTMTGKRDGAILAVLLGCGLCRAELLRINVEDLQQREGRGCCRT
jgi:integrase